MYEVLTGVLVLINDHKPFKEEVLWGRDNIPMVTGRRGILVLLDGTEICGGEVPWKVFICGSDSNGMTGEISGYRLRRGCRKASGY